MEHSLSVETIILIALSGSLSSSAVRAFSTLRMTRAGIYGRGRIGRKSQTRVWGGGGARRGERGEEVARGFAGARLAL